MVLRGDWHEKPIQKNKATPKPRSYKSRIRISSVRGWLGNKGRGERPTEQTVPVAINCTLPFQTVDALHRTIGSLRPSRS
ncbi:hypothetical protein HZ326_22331 [Fusarium oxysporum f. sp. albedinis]|nr:hypothetical protein HZ326_22331 [Fusarium oxysporum f. sp. albedinis]